MEPRIATAALGSFQHRATATVSRPRRDRFSLRTSPERGADTAGTAARAAVARCPASSARGHPLDASGFEAARALALKSRRDDRRQPRRANPRCRSDGRRGVRRPARHLRLHDRHDPDHGRRAAALIPKLGLEAFGLNDAQIAILAAAIRDHVDGELTDEAPSAAAGTPTDSTSYDSASGPTGNSCTPGSRAPPASSGLANEGLSEWLVLDPRRSERSTSSSSG